MDRSLVGPAALRSAAEVGIRVGRAGSMSALVAVTTMLALELLRVFPPLLTWQPGARQVGPTLWAGLFVAPFLGATALIVLAARGDARRVVVVAAATLAVARLATQVVGSEAQVVLAGVGLVGALALLGILALLGLPLFGGGVLAGVALDAALQVALGTRPLVWVDSALALVFVAALVCWHLSLVVHRTRREVFLLGRSGRSAVPLLVVGPVLVVQAYLLASVGWVAHLLGRGWVAASMVIGAGVAAGVVSAAWTARRPAARWSWLAYLGAAALVTLAGAHHAPGWWWAPAVVLGQAAIGVVLTAAVARGVGTGGHTAPAVALGLGSALVLAGLTLLDGRGILGMAIAPPALLVPFGVLAALSTRISRSEVAFAPHRAGRAELCSLLMVFGVPAVLLALAGPLVADGVPGLGAPSGEVRIVTYNVALAFDTNGRPNLAAVGDTLAVLDADVIALQEVPRGQLPAGGIDMVGWLERRLGMPHSVFQPATPGAMHGNAVLSRHPIVEVDHRWFARSGTALPRGAVAARVAIPGSEPLWVISAHLPPGGTPGERAGRAEALVELWGGRARTVVAADLNTQPGSTIVARLEAEGLASAWDPTSGPGHTYPAHAPRARIDWILHSSDVVATSAEVYPSTASDHRPLLATLLLD